MTNASIRGTIQHALQSGDLLKGETTMEFPVMDISGHLTGETIEVDMASLQLLDLPPIDYEELMADIARAEADGTLTEVM